MVMVDDGAVGVLCVGLVLRMLAGGGEGVYKPL